MLQNCKNIIASLTLIFVFAAEASRESATVKKHIELGKYAANFRDYDRAAQHYEEALKSAPKSKTVLFTLGALYQKSGRYDKAEEIYNKLVKLYPFDANAYLCRGDLFLSKKRIGLAVNDLQKATELDRENSAAYRNLGYAQLLGGADYSAMKSLEKAAELNKNDALIFFDLGVAYNKLGKTKKALKTIHKGLAIDNSVAAKQTYTDILEDCEGDRLTTAISDFNNNKFKKSEERFGKMINDFPDHALLYVYLGHILHFKKPAEPFAAEAAYRKAIANLKYTVLTPLQTAYLLDNLGMIRMNFGDYAEAEELFKKAVDENTDYPVAYFNYGCMLARRGRNDTAAVSFAEAARYDINFINYVSSHAALDDFRKSAAYTNFLNSCKQENIMNKSNNPNKSPFPPLRKGE